ncbi:hemerythrin domain-containing protein [Catenulispora subtropica]|uniref:Hemerythrin-like domain-containing protein n=1 Tax=Catenulispora subtropica TaxID=450798 RepID=A0ABP5EKJ2_9ACTN
MPSPNDDRTAALSIQLARAHQELRRQVAAIRADLGRRRIENATDATLVTHCLAFCDALATHHRGEDEALFARLVRARPDLAPTVAKLVEDHGLIATILARVAELADEAAGARSEVRTLDLIAAELDGLAAIMESHFGYEERTIGRALDHDVTDDGWSAMVFRFTARKDR